MFYSIVEFKLIVIHFICKCFSRPFKTPHKFYYSAINDAVNDRLGSQNGIAKIVCSFRNNKDAVV